jgi:Ca2+-binding EF-hand superfamily protein
MTRDKWSTSLVRPLVMEKNALMLLFILFMTVVILSLLNTIVGVVVESTLNSAKANEERAGKEKQKLDAKVMESLQAIFTEADADGSGELDREELHNAMKKPKVRQRMRLLDIPYKDLDLLFNLLDEDGTGLIKTDNFFRGCSKLRGPAMSSDLYHMAIDLDRSIQWSNNTLENLRKANGDMADLLNTIDTVELEIIQGDSDDKDPVLVNRRGRTRLNRAEQLRQAATLLGEDFSQEGTSRLSSKKSIGAPSLVRASLRASGVPETKEINMRDGGDMPPPPPPPMPKKKDRVESKQSAAAPRKSTKGWAEHKNFQWGTSE